MSTKESDREEVRMQEVYMKTKRENNNNNLRDREATKATEKGHPPSSLLLSLSLVLSSRVNEQSYQVSMDRVRVDRGRGEEGK